MRKHLSRHSDTLFLICMVGIFALSGGFVLLRWRIQPQSWETDAIPQPLVAVGEIENIGTRNYIIPIDNPLFVTATDAQTWLDARSPVIAVLLYDEARAYPLPILLHHEIVNDVLQNHPIAITYCPGCNSAIVFDRIVNGDILRFDVSGYVHNSGFIMMDEETESYWKQFTGEAISGRYTGTILEVIPSVVVGFAAFADRYPDGLVLTGDADNPRNYDMNPYSGYDSNPQPMLSSASYDSRVEPLQRVLAAVVNGEAVAYSFAELEVVGVIHDRINGEPVVAFWIPGAVSVLDAPQIEDARDVGQAALFSPILADGRELTFRYDDGHIFDNETNSEWNIFGEAIAGELIGEHLHRYQCFPHFWFAWSATYPETQIYEP